MEKPNISKIAFWDIHFEKLDYTQNSPFIINKVFNYGTFSDQLNLIRFYGIDKIKQDIILGAYFKKTVFEFICSFFELDKNAFVAYQKRQQQPNYWN